MATYPMLSPSFINPRVCIMEIFMSSQVSGSRMSLEVLGSRASRTKATNLATRLLVHHLLVRLRLQVLAYPQSARISARFPGR